MYLNRFDDKPLAGCYKSNMTKSTQIDHEIHDLTFECILKCILAFEIDFYFISPYLF